MHTFMWQNAMLCRYMTWHGVVQHRIVCMCSAGQHYAVLCCTMLYPCGGTGGSGYGYLTFTLCCTRAVGREGGGGGYLTFTLCCTRVVGREGRDMGT